MKVYVVMGNDFPAAVFDTQIGAREYCVKQRARNAEYIDRRKIYWNWYKFELNEEPRI